MARSRRKTTGTKKGAAGAGSAASGGAATSSAAFATAHEFVDKPAAASKGETRSSGPKAAAGTAAGSEPAEEAAAAPGSTERASVAASAEAAEAADRAVAEGSEPVPGAAPAGAETPAAAEDPAVARAAEADERPGTGTDPYSHGTAAAGAGAADYGAGDQHDALHAEAEHERLGAATIALMVLAGIIVVAVLTLWLAPKAAPHLPSGIARYLAPGQVAVEDRLGALEARVAESEAAADELMSAQPDLQSLESRIEELQAEVEALGGADGGDAEARAELESAAGERADLAARVEALESDLSGVRAEIDAMNQALAEGQDGEGPTTPELATALAQLRSRVESVVGESEGARSALSDEVAALSRRLDEALARTEEAESARAEAEAEAGRAAATAALNQALARLESRFERGEPYDEALDDVESLTGSPAPEALAGAAELGVRSTSALADDLSRVAREALAAAPREDAVDGPLDGVSDWLRAQVAGRPTVETPGDSVGAILSRVEARLEEGEPSAALAEAESLPEPSRAAIATWLEQLAARAAAAQALDEWRAGLAAAG